MGVVLEGTGIMGEVRRTMGFRPMNRESKDYHLSFGEDPDNRTRVVGKAVELIRKL